MTNPELSSSGRPAGRRSGAGTETETSIENGTEQTGTETHGTTAQPLFWFKRRLADGTINYTSDAVRRKVVTIRIRTQRLKTLLKTWPNVLLALPFS